MMTCWSMGKPTSHLRCLEWRRSLQASSERSKQLTDVASPCANRENGRNPSHRLRLIPTRLGKCIDGGGTRAKPCRTRHPVPGESTPAMGPAINVHFYTLRWNAMPALVAICRTRHVVRPLLSCLGILVLMPVTAPDAAAAELVVRNLYADLE